MTTLNTNNKNTNNGKGFAVIAFHYYNNKAVRILDKKGNTVDTITLSDSAIKMQQGTVTLADAVKFSAGKGTFTLQAV